MAESPQKNAYDWYTSLSPNGTVSSNGSLSHESLTSELRAAPWIFPPPIPEKIMHKLRDVELNQPTLHTLHMYILYVNVYVYIYIYMNAYVCIYIYM